MESSGGSGENMALLSALREDCERIRQQVGQRVIGQRAVVDRMLVALFARGHCLFIGVPGLAKTLLVTSVAQSLGLDSNRIQFTPDLMPADILGTEVLEEDRSTGHRGIRFLAGPVFTNLLLADEINRTPPRTQSALLQAMQERRVSVGGAYHPLPQPFHVLATQNPIEQEGTYPLPEAQLDRFMLSVDVGYPQESEEIEIVRQTTRQDQGPLQPVVSRERLLAYQGLVRQILDNDNALQAAVQLARESRPESTRREWVKRYIQWGAGPRASQNLVLAAKALAAMDGRPNMDVADVWEVAPEILQHRVVLTFAAEAEGKRGAALARQLVAELRAEWEQKKSRAAR